MVGFPLLLIPLAVYNIIVFLMPGVSLAEPLVRVTLLSGEEWAVSLSDVLLALGILLLLLEVIKGARPGAKYVTDHLLSFVVFGAAAAEFLLWPKFGTSTYCLLTLLALVDFISGIALRVRRRPAVAAVAPAPSRRTQEPEAAVVEPEPVPPPAAAPVSSPLPASAPPAAAAAEPVHPDHPEPKAAVQPVVPAPEPQPGGQPDPHQH